MKTIVITKVYEVRESNKGYSQTQTMWFDKEKALEQAKNLTEVYRANGLKTNFRVYEHTCGDIIIYTEE